MVKETNLHQVPSGYTLNERLKIYLVGKFPKLNTATAAKKAIKKNQVYINGILGRTGYLVKSCDTIRYTKPKEQVKRVRLIDLSIVYEDEYFLVINKPFGVVSVSSKHRYSIQESLKYLILDLEKSGLNHPQLVHRLDRDTGGLLIAAKTMHVRRLFDTMLQRGAIAKTYTALVQGHLLDVPRAIQEAVDDKEAKTMVTKSQLVNTLDLTSLLIIQLETGRKHQIRKHLCHIGHPLVGDNIHNKEGLSFGRGLFLMATHLQFRHPITDRLVDISIPLHKKFLKYIGRA